MFYLKIFILFCNSRVRLNLTRRLLTVVGGDGNSVLSPVYFSSVSNLPNSRFEEAGDRSLREIDSTEAQLKLRSLTKDKPGASDDRFEDLVECFNKLVTDG